MRIYNEHAGQLLYSRDAAMRFYEPRCQQKLSSVPNVISFAARLFLQSLGETVPIYSIMDGRKLVPYQCVVRREVRTFQSNPVTG